MNLLKNDVKITKPIDLSNESELLRKREQRIKQLLQNPLNHEILKSLEKGEKSIPILQEELHQLVEKNVHQLFNEQLLYKTSLDWKNYSYGITGLGREKRKEYTIKTSLDDWL